LKRKVFELLVIIVHWFRKTTERYCGSLAGKPKSAREGKISARFQKKPPDRNPEGASED